MMVTGQRLQMAKADLEQWNSLLARIDQQRADLEALDNAAAMTRPGLALAAVMGDANSDERLKALSADSAARHVSLNYHAELRAIADRMAKAAGERVQCIEALDAAENDSARFSSPPAEFISIDRAAGELASALEKVAADRRLDQSGILSVLWCSGLARSLGDFGIEIPPIRLGAGSPPIPGACEQFLQHVIKPAEARQTAARDAADKADQRWSALLQETRLHIAA